MARNSAQDVPATPHFDFLHGSFSLSRWSIPYLVSTIDLSDAASSLHTTADIPGAEQVPWKVEELYQRDIDWPRVYHGILPYLRSAEVPQFFNALTIALLPFDSESKELLSGFSADIADWVPPGLKDAGRFEKATEIGPISLGYWSDWDSRSDYGFQSGQVRWNTDQVYGVAIDGQHRLAAIKAYEGTAKARALATRVPVILIIFDERLGFEAPPGTEFNVVELLRALFIDLNKHARTVNRARQILLDDRDPHAVCARSVIGAELESGRGSLNSSPPRLPLSLVDWHREQAKFDDGPYLTTVLGIDWMVSKILGTKPIGDFTDYAAISRQIGQLEKRLGIDLSSAVNRVETLENTQVAPFSYEATELESISSAFAEVWGGVLCHLLTSFASYATLLSRRIGSDTLSLEFQHWYRLWTKKEGARAVARPALEEYTGFLDRMLMMSPPLPESYFEAALEGLEALKESDLCFNVAFQRAYMIAFLEWEKFSSVDLDLTLVDEFDDFPDFGVGGDAPAEDGVSQSEESGLIGHDGGAHNPLAAATLARVREFVKSLNRAARSFEGFLTLGASYYDSDTELNELFWLGTLRKVDGGIDFTQGASVRAGDLLFVVAAVAYYLEERADADIEGFWDACLDGETDFSKRVGRAFVRLSKETNLGGRIVKSQPPFEYVEEQALEEVFLRVKAVWDCLRNGGE